MLPQRWPTFIFCLALPALALCGTVATPQNSVPSYAAAIRAYQENHYDEAFASFQKYFAAGHDFAALDYNWGLAAYKLKKNGLAVGLLRRALYLNPDLRQASQALTITLKGLPHEWSDNSSLWGSLHAQLLDRVTLNQSMVPAWLLFCLSGIFLVRYFAKRRKAHREQQNPPPPPVLATMLGVLFFISLFFVAAKAFTLDEIRATVIEPTAMRTGPNAQDNPIFDLLEGYNVSVQSVQNGWVHVALDSGQIGWVPAQTLFQSTGRRLLW